VLYGGVGQRRPVESIIDDSGHYDEIRSVLYAGQAAQRSSGEYNYVDARTADPDSGEQAARSQGYQGLDPSALATLRQPQRPHDYAALGASSTEHIEMTAFDAGNDQQNGVSQQLSHLYIKVANKMGKVIFLQNVGVSHNGLVQFSLLGEVVDFKFCTQFLLLTSHQKLYPEEKWACFRAQRAPRDLTFLSYHVCSAFNCKGEHIFVTLTTLSKSQTVAAVADLLNTIADLRGKWGDCLPSLILPLVKTIAC